MSVAENLDLPATAPVKGGVIAYLSVDGALKAADFYQRAFGAEIAAAQPTPMPTAAPCMSISI